MNNSRASYLLAVSLCLGVALVAAPAAFAASAAQVDASVTDALELQSVLSSDGTFVGGRGATGTVDTSQWRLASDLAAGERPRFEPVGAPTPLATIPENGSWSALGSNGADGALNGDVYAIAVSGTDVYVGGVFTNAAGISTADYIARWDGNAWSGLGSNNSGDGALTFIVRAIAISGTNVYVGGGFPDAAGIDHADYIALWNGSAWSALGSNPQLNSGALNNGVYALAVSGSNLYVGGGFVNAGGIETADYVAMWNGSAWSALSSNGSGDGALNDAVVAISTAGTSVYVTGNFTNAAATSTLDYVAMWNGSAWSALGSNGQGEGALNDRVWALATSGSNVYVAGSFTNAGGVEAADNLARWNGSAWAAVGSGSDAFNDFVYTMTIADGNLCVGGGFTNVGGNARADYVACLNALTWTPLGQHLGNGALTGAVSAMAASGSNVYAGGSFVNAANLSTADHVALYTPPTATYQPDGRIKKGTSAYVGNDIYNADGTNQTKSGKAARGSTIKFTISIQNDGDTADNFAVHATGAAASNYSVKYFRGTSNVTTEVVSGSHQTSLLQPDGKVSIQVKVKVLSGATAGSSVTRLVTITSLSDGAEVDAVKLIGARK